MVMSLKDGFPKICYSSSVRRLIMSKFDILSKQKHLIVIAGVSGTGKTVLAEKLSNILDIPTYSWVTIRVKLLRNVNLAIVKYTRSS